MISHKEAAASPARDYLKQRGGRPGPHPLNPLDHLAFALMADAGETTAAALAALSTIRRSFVDWNEVRVARTQELARVLDDIAAREECAVRIIDEYNAFFEKRGALGFDFLATGKVAEGRKLLHQYVPRLRKGAVALLLYEFCPGAALPVSDAALKAARKEGLIGKSGDGGQLAKALAESLTPTAAARAVQYLELDATGNPYGEQPKAIARPSKAETKKSASAGSKKRP